MLAASEADGRASKEASARATPPASEPQPSPVDPEAPTVVSEVEAPVEPPAAPQQPEVETPVADQGASEPHVEEPASVETDVDVAVSLRERVEEVADILTWRRDIQVVPISSDLLIEPKPPIREKRPPRRRHGKSADSRKGGDRPRRQRSRSKKPAKQTAH